MAKLAKQFVIMYDGSHAHIAYLSPFLILIYAPFFLILHYASNLKSILQILNYIQ
jgi:hypothetical protein